MQHAPGTVRTSKNGQWGDCQHTLSRCASVIANSPAAVDDTQRNVDDVFQFDGGIQVSGVVSGTTVRALALGCFSQKN